MNHPRFNERPFDPSLHKEEDGKEMHNNLTTLNLSVNIHLKMLVKNILNATQTSNIDIVVSYLMTITELHD